MTDKEIWRIIKAKYSGSVDPPSLMAQLLFDVARQVSDTTSMQVDNFFSDKFEEMDTKIEVLENEIRVLKGLEPIWTPRA